MVNYCKVIGCTNRSDREIDRKFFRLPAVIANQGEECRKLSEERRRRWGHHRSRPPRILAARKYELNWGRTAAPLSPL